MTVATLQKAWIRLRRRRQVVAVPLYIYLLGGVVIAEEIGTFKSEYVETRHDWTLNRVIDTFDGSGIRWFALAEQEDVRFTCDHDGYKFEARSDGFLGTLGSLWLNKPIQVKIKVDQNPTIGTLGKYPNTLVNGEDTDKVLAQMKAGNEVRIRTQHGRELHTFVVSLKGFEEASGWVIQRCGIKEMVLVEAPRKKKLEEKSGRTLPVALVKSRPMYTDEAIKAGVQGAVFLRCVIRRTGRVDNCKVVRGLGHGLDENSICLVETHWRFRPATLHGQPVDDFGTFELRFKLTTLY